MALAKRRGPLPVPCPKLVIHARSLAKYWAAQPGKTKLEVAQGAVFSLLVALDGGTIGVGPFAVRRIDRKGRQGIDIAGRLHDRFYGP